MPFLSADKSQSSLILSFKTLTGIAILVAAGSGLSACKGCGSDKPYTPFGVASTQPSAAPAPLAASEPNPPPESSSSSGVSRFAARKAELVPGAARVWQGGDLSLTAPEARVFAQVLSADFDGDQKPDAIAWLVAEPSAKDAAPGELWYFANGAPGRKLSALPGFVPNSPDCPLSPTLAQTGPHSATLDVVANCRAALIARSPTRALVVVSPNVERPVLLTLRSAAAAPNESLNFAIDSSDQDQDGRDDVKVMLSVGVLGSSEPASADLSWLDRAAGASRAASEPGASLLKLAGRIAARSRTKHGSNSDRVGNAIRLLSSLCAESGVTRIFDEEGTPFRCGDLTHVIDALLGSDVESALAQGDVLEAFAALGRDGWYFAKLTAGERKTLERDALRAVTRFDAEEAFVARTVPLMPRLPHYSPLWFEADGGLLIRSEAGVFRLSPDHATEGPLSAEAGAPSWPLELVSGSGVRVTGSSHACDSSELILNSSDADHRVLPPLTTRLLAARPASCTGHGTGPSVSIAPFAFDGSALDLLLAGSHLNTRAPSAAPGAGLPTLGSPRSLDGRVLVSATPLGLLLTGDRKELWQTDKLTAHASAGKFSDCVVANDARAVACIDAGRVVIFQHPKQPSPSASPSSVHK